MQTRRILWAALLAATFVYLVVLQVAVVAPEPPEPSMPIALAAMAVMALVVAIVLPSIMLKNALAQKTFAVVLAGNFGDLPSGTKTFENPDAARAASAGALQTAFILRMALFESVALYGFVLGFLGTPLRTTLIFFVVAWLAMIAQFPSQGRDDAAITRATGIRFP